MALGAISPGVKTTMNNVAANAITNRFPVLPSNTTYAQVTGFSFDQNGAIRLYDPNFNTSSAEPWKSYLAAQYATGTPFEVLYELATPQTFTIEPFSIKSLPGTNNIFTDGGDEIATTLNPFGYIFHKLLAL